MLDEELVLCRWKIEFQGKGVKCQKAYNCMVWFFSHTYTLLLHADHAWDDYPTLKAISDVPLTLGWKPQLLTCPIRLCDWPWPISTDLCSALCIHLFHLHSRCFHQSLFNSFNKVQSPSSVSVWLALELRKGISLAFVNIYSTQFLGCGLSWRCVPFPYSSYLILNCIWLQT